MRREELYLADIIGFRNIVVYAYFSVNWGIVWVIAVQDVPDLRGKIEHIIKQEFEE